ncbi:uncharacterized protein LOC141599962 isoform X2 [Silene latifolia]|uniref:uncharacterized protein LOC141599962 isoform X2 n=1 Tax=Silene latifolia TaxID=37657 RepID=UPI003D7804EF
MSRCFPFPPPGYQTNIKPHYPASLSPLFKEQNRTEKNHKKEKKGKEKKESKEKHEKERIYEKHEKERIYEKHREKKNKKEKHRDKKEKGLDNDKHKGIGLLSDEKRPVRPPNADLHKLGEKRKNRENDGSVTSVEKRVAGQSIFNYGEPVSKSNHLVSHTKIDKIASALDMSNFDGERRINNQFSNNVSAKKNKDGGVKFTGTGVMPVLANKEKTNEKTADVKKTGALRIVGENKFCGNALVQNVIKPVNLPDKSPRPMVEGKERKEKQAIVGVVQNRVGTMVKPVEKKLVSRVEKKGQARETEKEDDEKKPIHKVKDMDMVTKEEENVKAISEQKRHAQIPSKRDGSEHHMCTPSAKNDWKKDLSAPLSNGIQNILNTSNEGSATLLGKRKDIGLSEQMTEPNKLARTTASTHPLTETEPCQNSAAFASRPPMNTKAECTFGRDGTQRPSTNIKVEGNALKRNDTKTSPITQSSQITSKSTRKSEVSATPLHPDTKYLTQVLTVPKLDEWPEFDDQEWLFRGKSSQTRKPKVATSCVEGEPTVWASAVWLDPVQVFALPYVLPY